MADDNEVRCRGCNRKREVRDRWTVMASDATKWYRRTFAECGNPNCDAPELVPFNRLVWREE